MEGLVAMWVLEMMMISAVNSLEKARRKRIILKWAKGELTMKELLWLKRQRWFRRAFQEVEIDRSKKDD